MAASTVRRCCLLIPSRLCARTYLSRCRSTPSHKPLSASNRWFSQEGFNEPESGYRYAKNHEWASTGDSDTTTIGISNYAQEKLGDIVFVELPEVGAELEKEGSLGVLESVKAAADIYTPVGGTVAEVNSALEEDPDLVNQDPYNKGWLIKLKDVNKEELDDLMSTEAYEEFLQEAEDV